MNEPCSRISNKKDHENLQRSPIAYNRSDDDDDDNSKKLNQPSKFKRTYHVETKTGKRGFLGLSPTGRHIYLALVFIFTHYDRYKCKCLYANT